jgi:hypothetical protein
MLQKVATIPLLPFSGTDGDERSFALSDIPMSDRLDELEFYFPLRRLAPRDLKNIFSQGGALFPQPLMMGRASGSGRTFPFSWNGSTLIRHGDL